jgi:sortase A
LPARPKAKGIVHAVVAGETLAGIAAVYGASIESLLQANRLEDASRIRGGQKPRIPVAVAAVKTRPEPTPLPLPADAASDQPGFPIETGPLAVAPPPAGDPPQRIVVPRIKLDTKVIQVGWRVANEGGRSINVWEVADFAAGWHRGSAHPGNVGNTVISGHHNIKGEVFRYLVDLEKGDEIDVFVGKQRYPYQVTDKQILREKGMPDEVRATNARWIAQTTDERLTLVTCWPYSSNTHRVIVVARPMWK